MNASNKTIEAQKGNQVGAILKFIDKGKFYLKWMFLSDSWIQIKVTM